MQTRTDAPIEETMQASVEPLTARQSLPTLLRATLGMTLILAVMTGIMYPLAITGVAKVVFPNQANGSMVERDGSDVGSALIGQEVFGVPGYLWGRPSAAGDGYDANASGGSNLSPRSTELLDRIAERVRAIHAAHPEQGDTPIPVDLVTASASGLDPHISPAAAAYQVSRIARERGISESVVRDIIAANTSGRALSIFGESRVNVLEVNLALDERAQP